MGVPHPLCIQAARVGAGVLSSQCQGIGTPPKGLQLTTDSWAFLNSVAFWRWDFRGIALTVSAAW